MLALCPMSEGGEPGRILLVDDDPEVRRGYGRMLRSFGWTIDDASDGREAVTRLGTASFDAIVSDIDMPDMSGLAFLRAVRERDLDVPVVLMTGAPSLKTAIQAVEQGAFRYLIKPVEMKELDEVVRLAAQFLKLAKKKSKAADRGRNSLRPELLRGVRGAFGSDGDIGLPELVQLLCSTGKTGCLKVSGSDASGEIHFLDGAVIEA
jgi:DNA-binding NtrC family response regulator